MEPDQDRRFDRSSRETRILFASDGSDGSEAACRFLLQLPLPQDATIQVLTVVEGPGWESPD